MLLSLSNPAVAQELRQVEDYRARQWIVLATNFPELDVALVNNSLSSWPDLRVKQIYTPKTQEGRARLAFLQQP